MELYGIALSLPAAFIATSVYRLFLLWLVSRFRWVGRIFLPTSLLLLGLIVAEVMMLIALGAVRCRGLIGPLFYVVHVLLFILGTPALANTLVLRFPKSAVSKWYVVASLCTMLAFVLVLTQYHVSEELYGINGTDGPYS